MIAYLYIVCFVFTEVTVKPAKIGSEIYREQISKCIISEICNYTAWNAPPYKLNTIVKDITRKCRKASVSYANLKITQTIILKHRWSFKILAKSLREFRLASIVNLLAHIHGRWLLIQTAVV